jgi:hypothetical protein
MYTAGQTSSLPAYRQEGTKEGSEQETGAKEATMRKTHNFELSKTILKLLLELQVVIAFYKNSFAFSKWYLGGICSTCTGRKFSRSTASLLWT